MMHKKRDALVFSCNRSAQRDPKAHSDSHAQTHPCYSCVLLWIVARGMVFVRSLAKPEYISLIISSSKFREIKRKLLFVDRHFPFLGEKHF
jgi:hypothetical protein